MGSVAFDGAEGDPGRRRRLPPAVLLPQADTERLLTEALAAEGVYVERGVELRSAQRLGEIVVTSSSSSSSSSTTTSSPARAYGDGTDEGWGLDDAAAASVIRVDDEKSAAKKNEDGGDQEVEEDVGGLSSSRTRTQPRATREEVKIDFGGDGGKAVCSSHHIHIYIQDSRLILFERLNNSYECIYFIGQHQLKHVFIHLIQSLNIIL